MTIPVKHHDLLPKQPISKPNGQSRPSNPSAHLADLQLKSTSVTAGSRKRSESGRGTNQKGEKEDQDEEMEVPVIEFDSSKAPQPFLDGEEVLEKMRALGKA
ncbi:hypothetical protein AJ78_04634 [Emergomyces pasteurianus Ep9510]|uniref:Uncharacterized protein n=1 Tax=Emergomyces pasteurianus Ep9510 TaxID=1447872 RepID=A0A1J9QG00_9EURO|nr:hypothetical protein AJ78_04634 [Emergomyces pasteurianus Ep9510]